MMRTAAAAAASEQPLPRGPQPRTYRLWLCGPAAAAGGGVAPGLRPPPPPPRPRPASSIGCRAPGPRPLRPISAEQRLLETFFPRSRARRGHAAARGGLAGGVLGGSRCWAGFWPGLEAAGCSLDTGGTGLDLRAISRKYDSLPLTPIAFFCSWISPKADRRTKMYVRLE
ncbi:unnamed protein product [Rangifer tarandus platyrhynchus]|uniref:Uncharacterized protein n=2 Tax=Rangifer tarandus platyrhynchus TaxID=3082113 RepID=A0ABN8ZIQ8_RANTA|nr:unnamed protein product [Rangifer tarandus platyrhynchus]CAI9709189.1 unnamed protein product [Rangifer tarandus platyrhynchus]